MKARPRFRPRTSGVLKKAGTWARARRRTSRAVRLESRPRRRRRRPRRPLCHRYPCPPPRPLRPLRRQLHRRHRPRRLRPALGPMRSGLLAFSAAAVCARRASTTSPRSSGDGCRTGTWRRAPTRTTAPSTTLGTTVPPTHSSPCIATRPNSTTILTLSATTCAVSAVAGLERWQRAMTSMREARSRTSTEVRVRTTRATLSSAQGRFTTMPTSRRVSCAASAAAARRCRLHP